MSCVPTKTHTTTLWGKTLLIVWVLGIVITAWPVAFATAEHNEEHLDQDQRVFPSGHWIDDTYGFYSYWRTHHGELLFGEPVTAPLLEQERLVQYFERGRLEYHPELAGSPVLAGRVGAEYADALWLVFEPSPPPLSNTFIANRLAGQTFASTGFSVREPFYSFWQTYGGLETFGYPMSDPLWDYVDQQLLLVQYFERSRLELHTHGDTHRDAIQVSALGTELAHLRGLDMSPKQPGSVPTIPVPPPPEPTPEPSVMVLPEPTLQPTLPPTATPPAATPAAQQHSGKYIVVNLSQQWLYAYEGDTVVFDSPVSTGRDGFNTPQGNFAVYAKLPSQTMSGTIGGESYYVPNVPNVMYIYGGVALHGTYWHNQFGTGVRMSHGCINLPLSSAEWLYGWAPIGTPVYVRS